jgi:hypothetical protein
MLSNPEWERDQLLDLNKPSLRALSHILRNKKLWPNGFNWYYGSCDRCAMGIAYQLWSDHIKNPVPDDIYKPLNIEIDIARHLFTSEYNNMWYSDVTPEMVADRIDEYLKRQ